LIKSAFSNEVEIIYSTASVAAGGIAAGQSWLEWIHQQIRDSDLAIALLTPLSRSQPWLMWEAGAVSGLGLSRGTPIPVVPLLYGIQQMEVPGPLGQLQTKCGTQKQDVFDLLESIRIAGNLVYGDAVVLEGLIGTYLQTVEAIGIPGMYDLFISCPMSSIDGEEYEQMHATVERMIDMMGEAGHSAYSAIRRVGHNRALDLEDISAETDLEALTKSRRFLMIYPKKVASSCLLEAGYALAHRMPSTYFVRNDKDLPYMLRGALEAYDNARAVRFREASQILDLFSKRLAKILQN
jgi:hypothetical protein